MYNQKKATHDSSQGNNMHNFTTSQQDILNQTCKSLNLIPAAIDTKSFSSVKKGFRSSKTCLTAFRIY